MKPASILITDDERAIRLMLRATLESEGYEITEAADGREALDAINHELPDLVVLDLNMPAVDGIAVLDELKSMAGAGPPVIILTAYGSIPVAVKATRLGAVNFLEKPVMPAVLREAVRRALCERELQMRAIARPVESSDNYSLDQVRELLRAGSFPAAQELLTKAGDQNARRLADYFNLLGVLNEAQRKWRWARKCYGKAMRASKEYEPAQVNMRRIYELYTFGRTKHGILLGDEAEDPQTKLHN